MAKKKAESSAKTAPLAGALVMSVSMKWTKAATEALRPFGISPVQYLFLHGVKSLTGDQPVTQSDVARYLSADVMLTSKHVRELEAKNLLARKPHPTDTRARSLELTKPGRTTIKKAAKALTKVDTDVFGDAGGMQKLKKTLSTVTGWSS